MPIERQRRKPVADTPAQPATAPAEVTSRPSPESAPVQTSLSGTAVDADMQLKQDRIRLMELELVKRAEQLRLMEQALQTTAIAPVAPSKPIPPMPAPAPSPRVELEQPIQNEEIVEKKTFTLSVPSIPWSAILIAVLGAVVVWNLFGPTIKEIFSGGDDTEIVDDLTKPDKADDRIVSPVDVEPEVEGSHAQLAALNLYKMYAADWQGKMEIMKAASKQKFESDDERAQWINKEFAERFALAADPFLEELSQVMAADKESEMAAIMAGAKLDFDVKGATKKIDSAAKKIKK